MNHGMASWQELKIDYEINQISPNISTRLEDIELIPTGLGIKILTILIEWACQPQNTHPIEIARKKIKTIPSDWLIEHLPNVAKTAICLDDEWEYRRLLELLSEAIPKLLDWGIVLGINSKNEGIKEEANDYKEK
ncbi:hypothetical protein CXK86_03610 [Paenibacillus sp. BGI2013]|uniref:hypothetical protein n=1 Tax=Paenibacillus TaxID=44249 RepID=UPI00096ED086|nr:MULTISPECIES: hypothetical protein [Paenibacillus]OMF47845.1 hypothetical protein BK136_02855 [Paenibacillus amylolyticus]PKQ93206.1 hypothetical protein CXK86_03610 [Paenibacillus sp. BGI2013]